MGKKINRSFKVFGFWGGMIILPGFLILLTCASSWAVDDGGDLSERTVHYGYDAGFNLNTNCTNNTFVGVEAGYQTGASSSVGVENTFVGDGAGRLNTGGDKNTFIGKGAGQANTNGGMNTFVGRNAGNQCQAGADSNVAIGDSSGEYLGGDNNTFVGEDAGRYHQAGDNNVFIGTNCGLSNGKNDELGDPVPGANNVFIGLNCGRNNNGSGNVFIGYEVGYDQAAYNDESNLLLIGNSNSVSPLIYGDFSTSDLMVNGMLSVQQHLSVFSGLSVSGDSILSGKLDCTSCTLSSDRRYKKEIEPLADSLEKIKQLEGVSYFWRQDEFPEKGFDDRHQIGLIAQEVEKIVPEAVSTDENGYKSIAYTQLVPVLIEALKSQQRQIEEQKKLFQEKLDRLTSRLDAVSGERM